MNTSQDNWMREGACRAHNPAVFFPTSADGVEAAKAICAACPVQPVCLEHALTNAIDHGVWGGESEQARRLLRRHRRNGTTPPATRHTTNRDRCLTESAARANQIGGTTATQWAALPPAIRLKLWPALHTADNATFTRTAAAAHNNGTPITTRQAAALAAALNPRTRPPVAVDHLTPHQARIVDQIHRGDTARTAATEAGVHRTQASAVYWSATSTARADQISGDTGRQWRAVPVSIQNRFRRIVDTNPDHLFTLLAATISGHTTGTPPFNDDTSVELANRLAAATDPAAVIHDAAIGHAALWSLRRTLTAEADTGTPTRGIAANHHLTPATARAHIVHARRAAATTPTVVLDHLTPLEARAVLHATTGTSLVDTAAAVDLSFHRVRAVTWSATSTARADRIGSGTGRQWRALTVSGQYRLQRVVNSAPDSLFAAVAAAASGETTRSEPMGTLDCARLADTVATSVDVDPVAAVRRAVADWQARRHPNQHPAPVGRRELAVA